MLRSLSCMLCLTHSLISFVLGRLSPLRCLCRCMLCLLFCNRLYPRFITYDVADVTSLNSSQYNLCRVGTHRLRVGTRGFSRLCGIRTLKRGFAAFFTAYRAKLAASWFIYFALNEGNIWLWPSGQLLISQLATVRVRYPWSATFCYFLLQYLLPRHAVKFLA